MRVLTILCFVTVVVEAVAVSFVDITEQAGLNAMGRWEGATFGDYDQDGDLDLYTARTNGPDAYYQNQGDGTFVDRAAAVGIKNPGFGVATVSGDYDNDGDLDIFVSVRQGVNLFYRNDGRGQFQEVAAEVGLVNLFKGQAAALVDFDNDGNLDVFPVADDTATALFRNDGQGKFKNVVGDAGIKPQQSELGAVT